MPRTANTLSPGPAPSALVSSASRRQIRPRKPPEYDNEDLLDDEDDDLRIGKQVVSGVPIPSAAQQDDDRDAAADVVSDTATTPYAGLENRSKEDDHQPTSTTPRYSKAQLERFKQHNPEPNPFADTDEQRHCVIVPKWAMAATPSDAEQKLLGFIAYWMGYDSDGENVIGNRSYFFANPDDGHVYWLVTATYLGRGLRKEKTQIHRLIASLRKKLLIVAKRQSRRDGQFCCRIRLNWCAIQDRVDLARREDLLANQTAEVC